MTTDSAAVRRRLTAELALPSRLGHTALLLAGLAMAALAAAHLVTEPGLPMRTRVAFGAIGAAGIAWAGYALWVLARRRVLFARHRVVAARMAVAFTATFTAGALLAGLQSGRTAGALAAAAAGAVMLAAAVTVLVRAGRRVRELTRRQREIETALAEAEVGR